MVGLIKVYKMLQLQIKDNKIFAPLLDKWLVLKPEEKVRQEYLCRLVNDYGFNLNQMDQEVKVSNRASMQIGTTAGLMTGDVLTLHDLFYAMMLPSGNDASVALAENVGRIILKNRKRQSKLTPYKLFVGHMNLLYQ